jgi:hypothetical protein
MCARLSSKLSRTMLKKRISLNEPVTPPSAEAPLSEMGLAAEEPVEALEPAAERPAVQRTRWSGGCGR